MPPSIAKINNRDIVISDILKNQTKINEQLIHLIPLVQELSKIITGSENGGMVTRVVVIENYLKKLETDKLKSVQESENLKIEEKKGSIQVKLAIIASFTSMITAIIAVIAHFIK